jgi:DNA-binding transcriptional LysR family regulator
MAELTPSWDEWRTFREVLREGALSAAARRLGLTQPTVGRHIDQLEAALGFALFLRSPRGLTPTDAARALAPHVEAMASASAALGRAAAGVASPDDGVVRVTASEIVSCEVLPPILAAYRAARPRVAIELAVTNRNEDLLRRDADIAVRMARPTQGALVARRIGAVAIGLYAHRDYLERFGAPKTLADLARKNLIGFDRDDRAFRGLGGFAGAIDRENFAFRCDHDAAQLAALRAGVGVGGCQDPIARRTPELVRLFETEVAIPLEVWIVMHEDARSTPLIRSAFDHLAAGMERYVLAG